MIRTTYTGLLVGEGGAAVALTAYPIEPKTISLPFFQAYHLHALLFLRSITVSK